MPATAASLSQSDSTQSNALNRSLGGWAGVIGLATFFLVALMIYPPITDATKTLETPTWVKFFGRFHVIALHLPIGILALAAMMEACLALRLNRASYLSPAIGFALKFGAWGSAIAVVFGVILARKGGFDTAEFYAHQTLGIIATVGIIGTLALKLLADHTGRYVGLYRLLFATSMAVLSIGAHFGGNMVHGDDYLTKYAPESAAQMVAKVEGAILKPFEPSKSKQEPPTTPKNDPKAVVAAPVKDNATVYAALIAPVLSAKCNDCHNADKSKGDLRLDTHELILKGGGNGDTVVPGQPEKSKMITSVLLPVDEDDHMPPAKKTQLSKEEIELLSWWVKEGASKDLKVADSGFPDSLKPLVQTLLSQVKSGSGGGTPPLMIAMAEVTEQVNPALAEAMKKINGSGASLAPIAANNKELRFSALNVAKDFTDANLKDLEVVADSIVALDLAKTKISDSALATIAKMTHLRELHLENTAITDAAGAQLKTLANLEYLNLYSTKVTDKIFGDLEGLGKLKSVYLWQTGVTRPVADAFKAKHPAMTLNVGWTEADNAKVVAVAVVAPATEKPATPAPAVAPAPVAAAPVAAAPVAAPPAAAVAPAATPAPAAAATKKPADEKGKGDASSTALPKANDPNAKLYADVVVPILAAKCTSCHGQEKSKGKLRMHTFADLLKGGSDGATTVIAGKPADSLMIKRIKLAKDDDDHMPPADEPQATKEELALLLWWIEQGANEGLTIAEAKKTPEIEGYLKALASLKGTSPAVAKEAKPKAKPLTEVEKKAIADAAAKMSAINASLMQVSLDSEQLRLVCVNAADKFGDKELADLAPVVAQIVWADLARAKVTDAGLASLAKMTNLERLHLENTAITDGGLAQLSGLAKLEYLNLYGTKVTDAGIAKLATNKALKKLYVWQTGVTQDGAKKLQAAVPGLVVNVGLSEADIAKLVQAAQPPPKPAEAPKKDEPAKPAEVKPPAPAAKPAEVKPAAAQPAVPAPAAPKPAEVKPEAPKPAPAKEEPKPEAKPAEKPEVKADKPAASVL